jgi:hypothetical protein
MFSFLLIFYFGFWYLCSLTTGQEIHTVVKPWPQSKLVAPTPTPTPSPTPTPPPAEECDVVVESSESIQSAINARSSGTVCVMPGEWTLNAQLVMKANVSVIAYPGFEAYDWDTNTISEEHPHIIPGTCAQCGIRWGTTAHDNEFSGFEVSGGWSGIDIHANNVTVKNNYIHDTWYTSIFLASTDNVLVEHNRTEEDGQNCVGWLNPNDGTMVSPRHCHSVYLSNVNGYCGMNDNVIRENYFKDSGGSGVNFNGNDCKNAGQPRIVDTLVEGNIMLDVNVGPALWHGTQGTVIQNNPITIQNPYTPPGSTNDMPVSMRCGIAAWDEVATKTNNTFSLKSGYSQNCQF